MARSCRYACGVLFSLSLSAIAFGQVSLSVTKSGSDVVLSWSGGGGTYDVLRSTSPTFGSSATALASNASASGWTDAGAASGGSILFTYVVTDVANRPAINITSPCDTPAGGPLCNVDTTLRAADISGTTNAATVFVNDRPAGLGGGVFSNAGVPLALGVNTITAAAKGTNDNWAIDQITMTRANGNQPPSIEIAVSDRGGTPVPADGTTVYDPTPQIILNYNDSADVPPGTIDPAKLVIFVNGTDKTASFTKTSTQATYQVPPAEAWAAGPNFVYATVQDGLVSTKGWSVSAAAHLTLSNPVISSFSPAGEGRWGDVVTINGAGFDPTPSADTVLFNGVAATVSSASITSLTVSVPAGAQSGPVTVSVDGRVSAPRTFRVVLTAGWQAISSLVVNPAAAGHVFFTDKGSNDTLYELLPDGTTQARCALAEPTGLPVDSAGNLYFGNATTPGAAGPVQRYLLGGGTCGLYQNTRLTGETTASVVGAALTDASGSVNIYTADTDNGKIKRIDPSLVASGISSGQTFANPCGMVTTANRATLYFSSTNQIRSIPVPGGGSSTLVKNFVGGPKGLAITADDKLVIARSGASASAVSWFDPGNSANPFWDFATGLSSPQAVALGADAGGPYIVVAEPTRLFRLPRPEIIVTDDADVPLPRKFVVDSATPTNDCLSVNAITLKVKFGPATLVPDTTPRQLVTWTVEDPDDPSPDPGVDPNGSAGDDNFERVGTYYNQWEAVAGYAMTGAPTDASVQTEVSGNISKIRIHLSCHAGDNYRIRVAINVPIYGTIQADSETVTVWRRLHVERDSMGVGVGPFPDDDVAVGDVPDPLLDLLANAYRPAYIDVVGPDTGFDTPDVRFTHNVEDTGAAVADQGRLGRGSTSTIGRWVVYVQESYEGPTSKDLDPVTEEAQLGVTAARYSLVHHETIRDWAAAEPVDNAYQERETALHEISHIFGLTHNTGCIMSGVVPALAPVFCGPQIRTVRDVLVPGPGGP